MKKLFVLAALFVFGISAFGQKTKPEEKPLAPTFSSTTIDGKAINTADLKGKVIIINLWFINCPNCVEEIKLLNKIVDDYKDKDVVFLGLATNKKPDLEKFLKKNPFKFEIIPNAMTIVLTKFGTPDKNGQINIPFPVHVVIDREGKLVVRAEGIKGVEAVKNELKKQFGTK
jgi:peroxiredoxin